ncbi:putative DNA-binding protein hemimethylated [Legionella beliardensis]|uniref:Heat shock protein HspQ n=1 Tax=Legionella beliardensis TaxID=91822 RepID=A0A378HXA4_9GAMM|nr:heat shock protein HspQ [Legionella beliardensis]STX27548.1 putative DNA-binding protein hemimethylated [Legionella beliardensis]
MHKVAKFNIGDCVIHQRHGYRAVIIDIDPLFQASGRPNPQASKRDFATRNPWYRLLVDNSSQMTYVEECHLSLDHFDNKIDNPNLCFYLKEQKGRYYSQVSKH